MVNDIFIDETENGSTDTQNCLALTFDVCIGGDIGMLFPDTDPQWQDADSKDLTLRVREKMKKDNWEIVNIDVIIHAQAPKLASYKGQMKRAVAGLLDTDFANVNIKAKTNEGLDAVGQGQAMAATVSVLLRRRVKRLL